MTRIVALRASVLFTFLTLVFGAIAAGSQSAQTSALVLVGLVLVGLTGLFATVTPERVPARVRARR